MSNLTSDGESERTYPYTKRAAALRKGMVVGCKRVSALNQADLRQLNSVGTGKLFTDKASGKDTNWPQLTAMLEFDFEPTRPPAKTVMLFTSQGLANDPKLKKSSGDSFLGRLNK